jgi:hypothetical protein
MPQTKKSQKAAAASAHSKISEEGSLGWPLEQVGDHREMGAPDGWEVYQDLTQYRTGSLGQLT